MYYKSSGASDGYRKRSQTGFGGYDHRLGAEDGAIWDMKNMSGDYFPLASPRAPRKLLFNDEKLSSPRGIAANDAVYYVDGNTVTCSNGKSYELDDSKEACKCAFLGSRLIIFPDKVCIDTATGEVETLAASWEGSAKFADGTYAGEDAEACSIVTTGDDFPFNVGDAVTISGATNAENNKTLIIREISENGRSLGFYEHSFKKENCKSLKISRTVPDMDYICEHENRLFGCKGDTIYASKLGDPFNWNVFDGLPTDSFSVSTGSAGDFTACVSYGGYAIFFKEDRIYKLYGDKPSNFKLMSSATLGVASGAAASLAIAGEALYYLSRVGVMVYTGGIPACISDVFGDVRYEKGVGGSDGIKYYLSLHDASCGDAEGYNLFCYDTRTRLWYREDDTRAVGMAYCTGEGLYVMCSDGTVSIIGGRAAQEGEGVIESMLEFYDFTESSPDKKHVNSIQIRVKLSEGASLRVSMSFDDGEWHEIGYLNDPIKTSYVLPVKLHRCDYYRIRLRGVGDYKLYSLTREFSPGSEKK